MKKWLGIFIVVVLVLTSLYLLLLTGIIRFNYPSELEYPVRGIDISHHQSKIDWNLLEEENITFIFMKATEGGDHVDTKFKEYWKIARERDYLVGAYHFFRFCKTGWEQADNFIENVPKVDSMMPPIIDLEYGGFCKKELIDYDMDTEVKNFLEKLEAKYHLKPIIYSTPEFYKEYLSGKFEVYPIWMRGIIKKPDLPDDKQWAFWQYANKGRVKAIDGSVDLNVFNGNREGIVKLLR